MTNRIIIRAFLLLIFIALFSFSLFGSWSTKSINLEGDPAEGAIVIPSPDRSVSIECDGVELSVLKSGKKLPGINNEGVAAWLGELIWAPDSNAFCITESRGGEVGEWLVQVFMISNGKVEKIDVSKEAVKDFMKHYKCAEPEDPEVGAIDWIAGSDRLLLALEVPNHSSCPQMGMVMGYVIEIPSGKIIKIHKEKEFRAKYCGSLGDRFGVGNCEKRK